MHKDRISKSLTMVAAVSAMGLFTTPAEAQGRLQVERITGPVKDAGIYHVSSGTWTRASGATANVGPDIIYNADTGASYFGVGWEGSECVDEGILPSTANPNKTGNPGPLDVYEINGFEFGYCSLSSQPVTWEFSFYDSYVPCDIPSAPAHCINTAGSLPGIVAPAGGFCWLATFDLSGGNEICMDADGGVCAPGYDGGPPYLDHFGWGHRWQTVDGATTGPFLGGHNPFWYPEGEGTVYAPVLTGTCGGASGLGSQDRFALHGGALTPGCYSFGGSPGTNCTNGSPPAHIEFKMYSSSTAGSCATICNQVFCDTDLDNASDATLSGCDCSSGAIVLTLSGAGAFDGNATYPVIGLGTGVTSPSGVSELCLGGSPIGRYRYDVGPISGGTFAVDLTGGASGGTVPGIGGPLCNGTTWRLQFWHRAGMNPSRFSKGISGTIN